MESVRCNSKLRFSHRAKNDCKVGCPPGTAGPDGWKSCVPCPRNMYAESFGSFECSRCPEGYFTLSNASIGPHDCKMLQLGVDRVITTGRTLIMSVWLDILPAALAHREDTISICKQEPPIEGTQFYSSGEEQDACRVLSWSYTSTDYEVRYYSRFWGAIALTALWQRHSTLPPDTGAFLEKANRGPYAWLKSFLNVSALPQYTLCRCVKKNKLETCAQVNCIDVPVCTSVSVLAPVAAKTLRTAFGHVSLYVLSCQEGFSRGVEGSTIQHKE